MGESKLFVFDYWSNFGGTENVPLMAKGNCRVLQGIYILYSIPIYNMPSGLALWSYK